MSRLGISIFVLLMVLLSMIIYQQHALIEGQKAQMKQLFHSDAIALATLLGNEGLEKLSSARSLSELSAKENFAIGLLIQRLIVSYWIHTAFSDAEWRYSIVEDGRALMRSYLLRAKWETLKKWYPPEIRDFFEKTFLGQSRMK